MDKRTRTVKLQGLAVASNAITGVLQTCADLLGRDSDEELLGKIYRSSLTLLGRIVLDLNKTLYNEEK